MFRLGILSNFIVDTLTQREGEHVHNVCVQATVCTVSDCGGVVPFNLIPRQGGLRCAADPGLRRQNVRSASGRVFAGHFLTTNNEENGAFVRQTSAIEAGPGRILCQQFKGYWMFDARIVQFLTKRKHQMDSISYTHILFLWDIATSQATTSPCWISLLLKARYHHVGSPFFSSHDITMWDLSTSQFTISPCEISFLLELISDIYGVCPYVRIYLHKRTQGCSHKIQGAQLSEAAFQYSRKPEQPSGIRKNIAVNDSFTDVYCC